MTPATNESNLASDRSRREFLRDASLAVAWLSLPSFWPSVERADPRPAQAHDAAIALEWYQLTLDLIRTTPGFSPPVVARSLAYLGLTLYESLVPGIPGNRSLRGQLPGLNTPELLANQSRLHWPSTANAALASAVRGLFTNTSASNRSAIDLLEASFNSSTRPGPAVSLADSISWGRRVADEVLTWARTDGGHEGQLRNFPSDYVPPAGPGMWVPTPTAFQGALQPYWGENRTFAVASGAECESGDPPAYSENSASRFYQDAVEVYEAVNRLTDAQTEIARFWSDDPGLTATPPGHSISILNQVIREKGLDLAAAAECYLKVGLAVSDAFVTCWKTKYRYNLIRPVTYINTLVDNAWVPLLNTPPFPEFTSGHSVQSAAAFSVMADLFGDEHHFTDHTHDSRGLAPRTFTSFSQCAEEAAVSRLYGGIHFRPAIDVGLEQGRCVGQAVSRLRLKRARRF